MSVDDDAVDAAVVADDDEDLDDEHQVAVMGELVGRRDEVQWVDGA